MNHWQQFLDAVGDYLHDNWVKCLTAGLFMAAGWLFGKRRARTEFRKREFYDRINVSLNLIHSGTLQIRTILEKGCAEVFLNSAAIDQLNQAARETSETDPLLPLPKDDYWFFLNAALNEVAEHFSLGQLRRDLGQPVVSQVYVLCLTSEQAGTIRTRKVRAMLIQKKLLTNLPTEAPKFESTHHGTRWKTLQILAREYVQNSYKFIEMEICV